MPSTARTPATSTRRAVLCSCLAISLFAASVPARADNPPKFKNPDLNAFVLKLSDLFDSLGTGVKAEDSARLADIGAKMDALANRYSGVVEDDGTLRPGTASPEEAAAYLKWLAAEGTKTGLIQFTREEQATKSLAKAKQVGLACKLYASDNDGEFPPTLDVLAPSYVDAEALRKLLVSPFAPNEAAGYTYHPGLKESADPKTILLEDKFAPKAIGRKIVVHLDGSGEVTR